MDRKSQALIQYFNGIGTDKRVTKQKLKEFLAARYKDGLAQKIIQVVSYAFHNFTANVDFTAYCDALESLFNQDENQLKKFAFKIFDINGDKKLSENDLFDLMKFCSAQKGGYFKQSQEDYLKQAKILHLKDSLTDLFLDIFYNDYIAITQKMNNVKVNKGLTND